jgi:hypothetical protein
LGEARPAQAGPDQQNAQIKRLARHAVRYSTQLSSSPEIVQLAATASMAVLRAVARDRLTPTIDLPTTGIKDSAAVGKNGQV